MKEQMIERINKEIEYAWNYFVAHKDSRLNDWEDGYQQNMAKIRGMIIMLETVTGKEYRFNKDGVYEVK